MLVPNPKERCDDVDLDASLSGHVTGTKGEIEVLDEEKNVRGELDPLAEACSGGILAGNRDKKRSHFGAISIPRKKGTNISIKISK